MTSTILKSESNSYHKSFIATSQLIYQATVYGEDGESASFEVMADDYASATAQAQNLAYDMMIDISHIEIMCMG